MYLYMLCMYICRYNEVCKFNMAVANGPVGPVLAGPIIEQVI